MRTPLIFFCCTLIFYFNDVQMETRIQLILLHDDDHHVYYRCCHDDEHHCVLRCRDHATRLRHDRISILFSYKHPQIESM